MNKIKHSGPYDEALMDLNIETPEQPQQPEAEIPENPGITTTSKEDAIQRFLRVAQGIGAGTGTRVNRSLKVIKNESKPKWQQQKMQHKPAPPPQTAFKASAAELLARMTLDGDDDLIDPLALLLKPKSTDAKADEDEEHRNEDQNEA